MSAKPPASREDRLAAALRENLRRRKAQARARAERQAAQPTPEGPAMDAGAPPALDPPPEPTTKG
ncbi:MAG: hypothetical protein K2X11_14580 [Acetobacteraceae bacterium]|nr:hypothetical protein [Acetobacteraceae bacterium]